MAIYTDIRKALEIQLDSLSGLLIAWENTEFDPNANLDTAWCRSRIEFVASEPTTIGIDASIRMDGLLIVDVFTPQNKGTELANTWADTIRDLFQYGTVLTSGSTRVHIRSVSRSGGITDPPWYFVSVSIPFYCYEI